MVVERFLLSKYCEWLIFGWKCELRFTSIFHDFLKNEIKFELFRSPKVNKNIDFELYNNQLKFYFTKFSVF